jgi:hypothetical protein
MLQVPLAHASHNIGEGIFQGVGCLAVHHILLVVQRLERCYA